MRLDIWSFNRLLAMRGLLRIITEQRGENSQRQTRRCGIVKRGTVNIQTQNNMTFKQWQDFAQNINARARVLSHSRIDAGFALASTVGIHRCGCSLHNASIDDSMTGWCHNNPKRLKVARKANWMVNDWAWEPTRLAERIVARAWNKMAGNHGYCKSSIVTA